MHKEIASFVKEFFNSKLRKQIKPGRDYTPASGKVFDERELLLAIEAVLEGNWTHGRFAAKFEEALSGFVGCSHAMLCNSGSSANLLAFSSLLSPLLGKKRLLKGAEVITTAACFPTTVNPIITNNCKPVFVDIELGTYNAAAGLVEEAITEKTGAIFLTHTLGNPFDAGKMKKIAAGNGLFLLEDCCDALGSAFNGKKAGSFGDASTFSFYPAHHITTAEGGAVLTCNDAIAKAVRSIRDWGRSCRCMPGQDNACGKRFEQQHGMLPFGYDHKYVYSHLGYNLKGTDFEAAIGTAQMQKLPFFIKKRRRNFKILFNLFKDFQQFFLMPSWLKKSEPSWFGFPLTIKPETKISRLELINFFEKNKIGTRLLFGGNITKQPYFANNEINYRVHGCLENTDLAMQNTFWLGIYPGLSTEHFEYMHAVTERFLKSKRQ